jgi:hypothetical protein
MKAIVKRLDASLDQKCSCLSTADVVQIYRRRGNGMNTMASKSAKSKKRSLSFSLRTLFVVILIAGILFALISQYGRNRKLAIAIIHDNGGRIFFDPAWQPSWYLKILDNVLGPAHHPVLDVQFYDLESESTAFSSRQSIECKKLPQDFLAKISVLSELESLCLRYIDIADSDWQHISNFQRLRQLDVSGSNVSDNGLDCISMLPRLASLQLNNAKSITDWGMAKLSQSSTLISLHVEHTNITDQGLENLSPILQLMFLAAADSKVTPAGMKKFLASHPRCVGLPFSR